MNPPPHQSPSQSTSHGSNQPFSTPIDTAPSSYLSLPIPKAPSTLLYSSRPDSLEPIETDSPPQIGSVTFERPGISQTAPFSLESCPSPQPESSRIRSRDYMSVYSASSVDTDISEFSNPPAKQYRVPRFTKMARKISTAEKDQYIQALRSHQINTLVELRRIEKAFATLGTPDVSEPMTTAWLYYVDSNSLLTELRALTKNYPFSSYCLDEAKNRVYADPTSNRSWNMCWLVLSKIQTDELIPYYARYQASQSTMWGDHTPSQEQINQLTEAFSTEWSRAVRQMLRHWEQPPTR